MARSRHGCSACAMVDGFHAQKADIYGEEGVRRRR